MRKTAIVFILLFCVVALGQDKPYRILNSFNAGELTPLLIAREDLSKYQSGCSLMENMIPLPQGGAQKRPGTIYVAESKNNTKIRLIPFEYSTTQSYIIELGNQYARFFTNNDTVTGQGTETLGDVSGDCVGQWPMNDNAASTTVTDASATSNDGTAQRNTSAIYMANGQILGAHIYVDPTDYVSASDNAAYDFAAAFTLAGWIDTDGTTPDCERQIIHRYDSTSTDGYRITLNTSGKLEFGTTVAGTEKVCTSTSALVDGWYFFVGTRSAAGAMTLYIDSVAQADTETNAGAIGSDSALYFGIPAERDDLGTTDGDCVGHWKMNDNAANKTVTDSDGDIGNGTSQQNTEDIDTTGVIDGALTFNGSSDYITVSDDAQLDFADAFSIAAWVKTDVLDGANHYVLSRWGGASNDGYHINIGTSNKWQFTTLVDSGTGISVFGNNVAATNWTFLVGTRSAAGGMKFYIDGVLQDDTDTNAGAIATDSDMAIGRRAWDAWGLYFDGTIDAVMMFDAELSQAKVTELYEKGRKLDGTLDNIMIFDKALSQSEIDTLYETSAYEVATPYLTADLFELKHEQSADVLYITHPDYEPTKLSRLSNTNWSLDVFDAQTGPFRSQNTDVADFIAASATTGTVTLTATGCTPFIDGTTAGHEPSGSAATSKSQTGALFKFVHPIAELEYQGQLEEDVVASQVEDVSWMDCGVLYKGATWTLVTDETWYGTIEVQRNYTIGAVYATTGWETVFPFSSGVVDAAEGRNVSTEGTEDDGDAQYRVIYADELAAGGDIDIYFSTDQTEHVGIVEITAVASTTSATGTVVKTLGSTDRTHRWSEGSWNNYRGWPQTVTFFEDRLCFGGNTSQPDTVWGSVTSDYENMLAGTEDDDAIAFTLTSRQVNAIQWLIGKDKILIGTSGAEWTLSGTNDEPLAGGVVPKAEQHSTYGSANLQAVLANESVLFFQRGAERMRELAYNWELDSYVAPDMTILAKEVTGDGITDTAFQQIPDAILWCVRDDGEMATFSYERKENITAWSRQITDGDFESVAVIHGSTEDEVWVSVERSINDSTVRYIEYFSSRDFGSDLDDAFYVDSGYTYDSTATTSITELGHLIAEEVSVFGDSVIQTSQTVDGSGDIAITSALTVQVGLPYTVQMRTMPLSWVAQGMTIHGRIKRINEVITSWYNSGDFSVGRDSSTLETYSITGMTTNEERKTFPAGYDRYGYVFIYQLSPEPLTVLALMTEFKVQ